MKVILKAAVMSLAVSILMIGQAAAASAENVQSVRQVHPVHAVVAPPKVKPLNANGCEGVFTQACINVIGTGLHVDRVDTSYSKTIFPSNHCGRAYLKANGTTIIEGLGICQDTGRYFSLSYTFIVNENFANNTQLCVYWSAATGETVCKTIHS